MKRIIALALTLICVLIPSFTACDSDTETLDIDVDCNFTGLSTNELYGTVSAMMTNPSDLAGKTVGITAQYSTVYNYTENKCETPIIIALDPTNCCDAYCEVRIPDGSAPELGETATFVGTFKTEKHDDGYEYGYIDVSKVIRDKKTSEKYDIDAVTMTADELKSMISTYGKNYKTSELNGKTVRIFGHYTSENGYDYLCGLLDSGNGSCKATYTIELLVPEDITLPTSSSNYINTVEITGTFSYYTEGNTTYACINVTSASKAAYTF